MYSWTELRFRLEAIKKKLCSNSPDKSAEENYEMMDFSEKQMLQRFPKYYDYEWHNEDQDKYFRKLGQNARFIVEHFAKLWYFNGMSESKAKRIGLRDKDKNYEHWANEVLERIDFNEYEYVTGVQAGERPVLNTLNPNLISINKDILLKYLMYCMYDEKEFDDWIIQGVSQEKGYPKIDISKLPSVRKSYLAFIEWLHIKFTSKKNFIIDWYKILRFAEEISKLKANADYKVYEKKVFDIDFCECVVEKWRLCHEDIYSHEADINELTFIANFSKVIKKCKDWTYEVKFDRNGSFLGL